MELLGLIYSEFDNEVGPRLVYQYPENILTSKTFETLSDYIIVGKHLCEKIMIMNYDHQQIVNYSVAIENSKYGRNTLTFAFGFVLEESADSEPYEVVLRKISTTLIELELESEFLFCPNSKAALVDIMRVIYHGLTSLGEVCVQFDKANILSLKLFRQLTSPPPIVHDYEVPILLMDKARLENIPWDITAHRILPHINGRSCARKISLDAEVDLQCGKRCLRVLLFYQCILLSDIFAFSNVYITTSRILELCNPRQFVEIESFCSIPDTAPPSRENIFRLLLSLQPGVPISEIIATNPKLVRRIDLPRLLGIAQHLGFIRRVRKYPVLRRDNNNHNNNMEMKISQHFNPDSRSKISSNDYNGGRKTASRQLHPSSSSASASTSLTNGTSPTISNTATSCGPSTDEICCVMDLAKGDLEEAIKIFVWK